jgi:hypothetical protein
MADAPKRRHLENKIANHPTIAKAFATIGALLIVYKAKDLECDVLVDGHQFHIEVTEVDKQ